MKHRVKASKTLILFVQAMGLLLTMLTTFLGALYIFKGNYFIAFPISILFVVMMYYLVSYFIKEKEKKKRKGYPPKTYYFFVLYGLLSMVVSFFVLHCVNVELFEKEEIKKIGLLKLQGLEEFHKEYTISYNDFCDKLRTNASTLLSNKSPENVEKLKAPPFNLNDKELEDIYEYSPGIDTAIRMMKITPLRNDFKTKQAELLENKEDFFSQHKTVLESWDRLKISATISELNEKITADYSALNQTLKNLTADNKKLKASQTPYLADVLIDKPLLLANKHLGLASLIVLVLFQILILLPYFLTQGRQYGSN